MLLTPVGPIIYHLLSEHTRRVRNSLPDESLFIQALIAGNLKVMNLLCFYQMKEKKSFKATTECAISDIYLFLN